MTKLNKRASYRYDNKTECEPDWSFNYKIHRSRYNLTKNRNKQEESPARKCITILQHPLIVVLIRYHFRVFTVNKPTSGKLKIGFLWLGTPGYLINCVGKLASEVDRIVLFYVDGILPNDILANYSKYIIEKKIELVDISKSSAFEVKNMISRNNCNVLIICGWHYKKFMRSLRDFSGIKILTLDNQWKGNARQIWGKFYGRFYLKRKFHAVFVPGVRSREFAMKIGFAKSDIYEGLYVANNKIFKAKNSQTKSDFLFPGRLVAEKNVDELLRGYEEYRKLVVNPWNLKIAGWGPLEKKLKNTQGIKYLGKLSQLEMAKEMKRSKFTILPSRAERWGVVIQESVLSGTPVICSEECGAADYFVIDKVSGYVLKNPNFQNIATALHDAHMQKDSEYESMSKSCIEIATCFTPEKWSQTIIKIVNEHSNR